ncbi:MAG: ABC-type multidrug transport system fused ATPase/permease subunit, partial [Patescibacteria group bacterium]
GKSTIIQLLLQFYKIQGGNITVDGKSIYDYNLRDLRNCMSLVPQEVILFGGTIRENILYGKEDATDEEVIEAAKQSNSWEFIRTFPETLDTLVGERGVKLSGGQRQRIAIARAILKNPAILLLDEATSSLDAESEKLVQEALDTLMEGRTSIIIAHRLATIREVDTIFVLDQGQIVEQGTHDELSELENGLYSGLAKLQFEQV